MNKIILHKSIEQVVKEWDQLADLRNMQILNRIDVSYLDVIIPHLLGMHNFNNQESILDIGCGTGIVVSFLKNKFKKYVGVDFSYRMIQHAKKNCEGIENVTFMHESIETALKTCKKEFTVVISNMTFMDVFNLDEILSLLNKSLVPGGKLLISITHPYFWPEYKGYNNESWFNYNETLIIESPFVISSYQSELVSTLIHRPMHLYLSSLIRHNFRLKEFIEPLPSKEIQKKYMLEWKFPRFLFLMAEKENF